MSGKWKRVKEKIEDRMLLEAVYDGLMKKTKFKMPELLELYTVFVGQKHRMLYYKQMKKKYFADCVRKRAWEELPKEQHSDIVWVCWLQGMENAPPIVKRCYDSLVRHLGDTKTIRVIDDENVLDYVSFPKHILEKREQGIITPTHFSDLVRLELLIKYGGYWIDSTVFLTDDRIFEKVDEWPLFMYSFYYFGFNPEIMRLNSWFIYSKTNNNILCLIRELLYAYWEKETRIVNYFVFHIMMTMALEFYEEEYKQMPIVSQVDSHILATYIFDAFDERKYEILKMSTGVHKLSVRFDPEKMLLENTFCDHLLNRNLA